MSIGYASKELAESLTKEVLILKLRGTEHDFVERKSQGKQGDWLQVAIAFANSTPIGWPAVLFVGVDDDGSPQIKHSSDGKSLGVELERLAKSVSDVIDRAYPLIYRFIVPIELAEGGFLAVVIPGSTLRPHFGGKSYVRRGPQTFEASTVQFEKLILQRESIVSSKREGPLITMASQPIDSESIAVTLHNSGRRTAVRIQISPVLFSGQTFEFGEIFDIDPGEKLNLEVADEVIRFTDTRALHQEHHSRSWNDLFSARFKQSFDSDAMLVFCICYSDGTTGHCFRTRIEAKVVGLPGNFAIQGFRQLSHEVVHNHDLQI